MKQRFLLILFGLMSLTGLGLASQSNDLPKLPEVTADDPIVFDQSQEVLRATRNAQLRYGHLLLEADALTIDQTQGLATSEGNVRLTQKDCRVLADAIQYDFKANQVIATEYRMGQNGRYVSGPELTYTSGAVQADRSCVYLGRPDPFCVNVSARRAYGTVGDSLTLEHACVWVGKVPVFYWPHMILRGREQPIEIEWDIGRNKLGRYFQGTLYYRVHPQLKVGALLDYYERAGVLVGPAYNYTSTTIQSDLQGAYLKDDRSNRNADVLGQPVPRKRYFTEFRHRQAVAKAAHLTAKISAWSDSEILAQTRPKQYRQNQDPDSFVEGTYHTDHTLSSAFVRQRPNNFQRIQERLPEIQFEYFPAAIGETNFYQTGRASYANVQARAFQGLPASHVHRGDIYYSIRRPLTLTHWFQVVPVVGGRLVHYAPVGGGQSFGWLAGEVGFDAQMLAYSVADYSNSIWGIHGLRHILKPVLEYRYMPLHTRGNSSLAAIDKEVATNYKDPLDLGVQRKFDASRALHRMRMGFYNTLQTRSGGYGSRDLATLGLFQDVYFARNEGQRPLGNLYADLGLMPVDWFTLGVAQYYDPYTFNNQETVTSATLRDADRWYIRLSTHYKASTSESYTLGCGWQCTKRQRLDASWTFNARLGLLTYQRYQFSTRVGFNWDAVFDVVFRKRTERFDAHEIHLSFKWNP